MVHLTLSLIAALGSTEPDDGYVNQELAIRFKLPSKEYTLRTDEKEFRFAWAGSLCEITDSESLACGILAHYPSALKVEKYANWREEEWKKAAGVKRYERLQEKKIEGKKTGSWLIREHLLEFGNQEYHYVQLFIAKGKHNFELALWVPDAVWEDYQEPLYTIIDSVEYGEPVPPKKDRPEVTVVSPWAGAGLGSWVKFKTVSENPNSETEIVYVLLDQDEESYTMRTDTTTQGATSQSPPTKILLQQKAVEDPTLTTEEGTETLDSVLGKLSCAWVKSTTAQGWTKIWYCDSIPYRMVRMESQFSGARSVLELVAFEKK